MKTHMGIYGYIKIGSNPKAGVYATCSITTDPGSFSLNCFRAYGPDQRIKTKEAAIDEVTESLVQSGAETITDLDQST